MDMEGGGCFNKAWSFMLYSASFRELVVFWRRRSSHSYMHDIISDVVIPSKAKGYVCAEKARRW